MQSTTGRIGVLVAVIAAAVILFVVLSGDDDNGEETTATVAETTATTAAGTATDAGQPAEPPVIIVRNGKPVGGVQELTFERGERVLFAVELDQPAEEVHVHGYEIEEPATKSPVRVSFTADIDGVFDIEIHSHELGDVEIAKLTVNP
jgi:hypothetical protein